MKLQEQLKSGAALPQVAGGSANLPQDAEQSTSQFARGSAKGSQGAEQSTPQFVNEYVIERVLDVPVKTLRNWRVSGRGPPFSKFGASVRYELATAIRWARERQVNSTSEIA